LALRVLQNLVAGQSPETFQPGAVRRVRIGSYAHPSLGPDHQQVEGVDNVAYGQETLLPRRQRLAVLVVDHDLDRVFVNAGTGVAACGVAALACVWAGFTTTGGQGGGSTGRLCIFP